MIRPASRKVESMSHAILEITLTIDAPQREQAVSVYQRYRQPFLDVVPGAQSKELLVRPEDVQVVHGFTSRLEAEGYLGSLLFQKDVVTALQPLLAAAPEIRIYEKV